MGIDVHSLSDPFPISLPLPPKVKFEVKEEMASDDDFTGLLDEDFPLSDLPLLLPKKKAKKRQIIKVNKYIFYCNQYLV